MSRNHRNTAPWTQHSDMSHSDSSQIYLTTSGYMTVSTGQPAAPSTYPLGVCDVCGEKVFSDDGLIIVVMKNKEATNVYLHKRCYLTEPEVVKSLVIFEDLL